MDAVEAEVAQLVDGVGRQASGGAVSRRGECARVKREHTTHVDTYDVLFPECNVVCADRHLRFVGNPRVRGWVMCSHLYKRFLPMQLVMYRVGHNHIYRTTLISPRINIFFDPAG